jgi:hypothetical protein
VNTCPVCEHLSSIHSFYKIHVLKLGGTLKDVVYLRKLATLAVLREEIETACAAIHVDTLVNVAQAVVRRNQKCLDADGNPFERLL